MVGVFVAGGNAAAAAAVATWIGVEGNVILLDEIRGGRTCKPFEDNHRTTATSDPLTN